MYKEDVVNIFDKCYNFTRADEAIEMDMYPYFTPIQEVNGNKVKVDGKEMIMVGSNNYLGLLNHPEVMKEAQKAIRKAGYSESIANRLDCDYEKKRKQAKKQKYKQRQKAIDAEKGKK